MPIDPERFTTELPDHLLCEICLNVSYPPMVLCAQEHIACEDCLTKIQASPAKDKCPMCQQAMLKPTRPCLALKRAIEGYDATAAPPAATDATTSTAAAERIGELEEALREQTAKSEALEATLQSKEAQSDDNKRSDRLYTSTREYWLTGDGTVMSRKRTLDILTDSPSTGTSSPAHATSVSRSTIDHLPDASSSKKQRRSPGA
ncbi:hypothetical protein NBRC10513v2_002732 [Rhodotorula toruloides]